MTTTLSKQRGNEFGIAAWQLRTKNNALKLRHSCFACHNAYGQWMYWSNWRLLEFHTIIPISTSTFNAEKGWWYWLTMVTEGKWRRTFLTVHCHLSRSCHGSLDFEKQNLICGNNVQKIFEGVRWDGDCVFCLIFTTVWGVCVVQQQPFSAVKPFECFSTISLTELEWFIIDLFGVCYNMRQKY